MLIHKTMKLPTSCLSCWIAPTCEVWVAEKKKYKGYDNRLVNCPLEEVKHGHWIEANDISSSPFDAMKRCLCSECREWGFVTIYCPNCGAKMDEVGT